jgi:iron complex outermembrane receptor protein
MSNKWMFYSACIVLAALIATNTATAQTSGSAAASGQLEEIVVTAERRAENLQEVPISVSAFNELQLKDAGIANVSDLKLVDPALRSDGGLSSELTFLRGFRNADLKYLALV